MERRPCLLVADDEKEIRNFLKRALESEGYNMVLADPDQLEQVFSNIVLLIKKTARQWWLS